MSIAIHPSRYQVLQQEFEKPYFAKIKDFLVKEKAQGKTIYPKWADIFKAFDLTPFDSVEVVILGQDPYHGFGQAMWLSFSVPEWISLPPSLRNIYSELEQEGFMSPFSKGGRGDQEDIWSSQPPFQGGERSWNLTRWSEQGVLLLNSILTVRANEAASHSKIGRQEFTDEVMRQLSQKKEWLVFMLWGAYAQSKKSLIDTNKHLVLESVHPSPLSAHRWWFGCNHFTLCNEFLLKHWKKTIVW